MVNAIYGRHIGGEPANVGGPLVHTRSPVVRERATWDVEDDVGLLHSTLGTRLAASVLIYCVKTLPSLIHSYSESHSHSHRFFHHHTVGSWDQVLMFNINCR
jgi:hypothetical protein